MSRIPGPAEAYCGRSALVHVGEAGMLINGGADGLGKGFCTISTQKTVSNCVHKSGSAPDCTGEVGGAFPFDLAASRHQGKASDSPDACEDYVLTACR